MRISTTIHLMVLVEFKSQCDSSILGYSFSWKFFHLSTWPCLHWMVLENNKVWTDKLFHLALNNEAWVLKTRFGSVNPTKENQLNSISSMLCWIGCKTYWETLFDHNYSSNPWEAHPTILLLLHSSVVISFVLYFINVVYLLVFILINVCYVLSL